MRWFLPWALTVVLSIGLTTTARAAEPVPEPSIAVTVEAADLPELGPDFGSQVSVELQRRLVERELPDGVFAADDRRVIVEVHPGPIPDVDVVLVRVVTELDGELLGESKTDTCMSCSEGDVANKALNLVLPLLSEFPGPEPEIEIAPVGETVGDLVEEPATTSGERPLLISGAVLLGAGGSGLAVGIGLIAVNERVASEPGAADIRRVVYRPSGIATAVVGGALAVAGGVLVGVVLSRRGRAKRVSAVPLVGPAWGLGVAGEF